MNTAAVSPIQANRDTLTGDDMIEYTTKHPFYDCQYWPNARYLSNGVHCRIEKIRLWPFGHFYRCVFYTRDRSRWGFVKARFSESAALKLRDNVFANRHSYGFV